ncbi:Uncharacterised protein [Pseudomonas aeruginosa]|nr:Uncharacterised protein [Pseudomonas aeruginosa]
MLSARDISSAAALLADQREMPVAHGRRHVPQRHAADPQFAACRVHVARQQVQQGALAGTRRADQGHQAAVGQFQVDVGEDLAVVVGVAEATQRDRTVGRLGGASSLLQRRLVEHLLQAHGGGACADQDVAAVAEGLHRRRQRPQQEQEGAGLPSARGMPRASRASAPSRTQASSQGVASCT